MTYLTGASRAFSYPEDRHTNVWSQLHELAAQGNYLAGVVVKIDAAMKAKKAADAEGAEVPAWVRETLQFLDCYQNDEDNLDDALAALARAVA